VRFLDRGVDLLALFFAALMASRNDPAMTSRESRFAFPACAAVVVISNALIAFVGDHHSFVPGDLPPAVREAIQEWECFDADAGKDSAGEIRE
jgi:hypothetical protein